MPLPSKAVLEEEDVPMPAHQKGHCCDEVLHAENKQCISLLSTKGNNGALYSLDDRNYV
jgi:hypothetical protein